MSAAPPPRFGIVGRMCARRRPVRCGVIVVSLLLSVVVAAALGPAPVAAATPQPGRVLKAQPISSTDLPPGAASGQRLTYVTRDQNDQMALSTGVFYLPAGTPPAGGWPIVSWAHGTTGIADQCAPSATRAGTGVDTAILEALQHGYAVTATDYAGLGAAGEAEYLGGRAAAHSVIDMIRAARARAASLGADWVSVGHSQGGHAALFAGHEAPMYAPELRVRKIVAIAPASGIEGVLTKSFTPDIPNLGRINTISGLFLYILAGLDHARPDLHVTDRLSGAGKRYLDVARSQCNGEVSQALRSVTPGSLLDASLDSQELTAALADYTRVPADGYRVPIRIDHGLLDPVVPFPLTATLVRSMKDAGTDVDLHTHARADHTGVLGASLGEVWSTMGSAFGRD